MAGLFYCTVYTPVTAERKKKMDIIGRYRLFIGKKNEKETVKETETEDVKEEEARILSNHMAVCYEEIADTELTEESDDAVREIIYEMLRGEDYGGALSLLMIIFELAGKEGEADLIKDLSPEFIASHGSVMVRAFVRSLGMDPYPTADLERTIKAGVYRAYRRGETGDLTAQEE